MKYFSVAGPAAWNSLCDELREPSVSESYLRVVCLQSTGAYSALEVSHVMRYINILTYFLLTYFKKSTVSDLEVCQGFQEVCRDCGL